MSKLIGLPTWDKPAQACLSSRIPYGTKVSVNSLNQIEKAETYLHQQGFNQVRVRHHGNIARIEINQKDFSNLFDENCRKIMLAQIYYFLLRTLGQTLLL